VGVGNMGIPYNTIRTTDKPISIKGKVHREDSRRRIDIKGPIREIIKDSKNVHYIMEFFLKENKLEERIKELTEKNVTPVLLYFTEEC
jgi:hypothetical protein